MSLLTRPAELLSLPGFAGVAARFRESAGVGNRSTCFEVAIATGFSAACGRFSEPLPTMTHDKTLERRTFLTSTVATVATVVSGVAGCGDDGTSPADTTPSDGGTTASTESGATLDAAVDTSGASSRFDAGKTHAATNTEDSGASSTSESALSDSDTSVTSQSSSTQSTAETALSDSDASVTNQSSSSSVTSETAATTSSDTADSTTGSSPDSETISSTDTSDVSASSSGDDAGAVTVCATDTSNGDHSHPLVIPLSDITNYYYTQYVLEDGGTGHTHTVFVTPYDCADLQGGTEVILSSSEEYGHSHPCAITCPT